MGAPGRSSRSGAPSRPALGGLTNASTVWAPALAPVLVTLTVAVCSDALEAVRPNRCWALAMPT